MKNHERKRERLASLELPVLAGVVGGDMSYADKTVHLSTARPSTPDHRKS